MESEDSKFPREFCSTERPQDLVKLCRRHRGTSNGTNSTSGGTEELPVSGENRAELKLSTNERVTKAQAHSHARHNLIKNILRSNFFCFMYIS